MKAGTEDGQTGVRSVVVRELRSHPWTLLGLAGAMILGSGVGVVGPLLFKAMVDQAIPQRDTSRILVLLILIAVVPIVAAAMSAAQEYCAMYVGQSVTQAIRKRLFRHLIRVRLGALEALKDGDFGHRIIGPAGEIGDVFIASRVLPSITNGLLLIGNGIAMSVIDWHMLLAVAAGFVPMHFLGRRVHKLAYQIDKELFALMDAAFAHVRQVFLGIRTIRAFNGEPSEIARWNRWADAHLMVRVRAVTMHMFSMTFPFETINSILLALIYGYGAYEVVRGSLSIGGIVAFSIYIPQSLAAVRAIIDAGIATTTARVAADSIDDLLRLEEEGAGGAAVPAVQPPAAALEFRDVSFTYGRGDFCLDNLSFSVGPGEFVGIVGETGGGKSTILDLLLGFYPDYAGAILINGTEIRGVSLQALRERICLVPQEAFLWEGTLRYNLSYGTPDAADAEVADAVQAAGLPGFLRALPQGDQTAITNGMATMSGGERQRIAICRALLKIRGADILVMDEPTSALDAITEMHVRTTIEALRGAKTLLVIAHRLSTLMNADRVIVVQNGRVVESGRPQSLIEDNGMFQRLHSAQRI